MRSRIEFIVREKGIIDDRPKRYDCGGLVATRSKSIDLLIDIRMEFIHCKCNCRFTCSILVTQCLASIDDHQTSNYAVSFRMNTSKKLTCASELLYSWEFNWGNINTNTTAPNWLWYSRYIRMCQMRSTFWIEQIHFYDMKWPQFIVLKWRVLTLLLSLESEWNKQQIYSCI